MSVLTDLTQRADLVKAKVISPHQDRIADHQNRTLAAIAAVISVATVAAGDEIRTFQSGQNRIEVREYSPRDVSDKDRAIAMLQREWNTDETIQWDTAALLAILCEQVYSDDDETLDYLIRGIGFTEWIAIRNQSMAGHVLRGKDVTVVVFRGTSGAGAEIVAVTDRGHRL